MPTDWAGEGRDCCGGQGRQLLAIAVGGTSSFRRAGRCRKLSRAGAGPPPITDCAGVCGWKRLTSGTHRARRKRIPVSCKACWYRRCNPPSSKALRPEPRALYLKISPSILLKTLQPWPAVLFGLLLAAITRRRPMVLFEKNSRPDEMGARREPPIAPKSASLVPGHDPNDPRSAHRARVAPQPARRSRAGTCPARTRGCSVNSKRFTAYPFLVDYGAARVSSAVVAGLDDRGPSEILGQQAWQRRTPPVPTCSSKFTSPDSSG